MMFLLVSIVSPLVNVTAYSPQQRQRSKTDLAGYVEGGDSSGGGVSGADGLEGLGTFVCFVCVT